MKQIFKCKEIFGLNANTLIVSDGIIHDIGQDICFSNEDVKIFDFKDAIIFPGFTDVHVHLREPGFSYKETIFSGSLASAHGGYTTVCAMPNLNPCPDTKENFNVELNIIKKDAKINVIPYGTITKGEAGNELSDMDDLAKDVVAFSDDGRGVQSNLMMEEAMLKAKSLNKMIVAHCEDNSLLFNGYIHDGVYAKEHNHRGISSASEYKQIERDLIIAEKTGCPYHICHISTKESVDLIRKAKEKGVDVTAETAPHYLVLDETYLEEDARFKMNPPLRAVDDRLALIEGIKDGTIDIIATDHAPHSDEEKSRGLEKSLMGISGIETAFPILYTKLVKTGIITLKKLIELINKNPNERFKIGHSLKIGESANFTIFNLDEEYIIKSNDFLSKGKSTPFENYKVFGKCKMTVSNGFIIWEEK